MIVNLDLCLKLVTTRFILFGVKLFRKAISVKVVGKNNCEKNEKLKL